MKELLTVKTSIKAGFHKPELDPADLSDECLEALDRLHEEFPPPPPEAMEAMDAACGPPPEPMF